MHESVQTWVAGVVAGGDLAGRSTLEVGSYDVNGSVRPLFSGAYVGVDHAEGPGVDKVADAEHLPFADASFEVVVSTEMLEHAERPWLAVAEMARVCEPGGTVIITVRGFMVDPATGITVVMHKHDEPDLWRFSGEGMAVLAEDAGLVVREIRPDNQAPGWLMVCGKPGDV